MPTTALSLRIVDEIRLLKLDDVFLPTGPFHASGFEFPIELMKPLSVLLAERALV